MAVKTVMLILMNGIKKNKENKMEFEATEEQVKQIFCNAINASSPAGMGNIHYQAKEYIPEDIKADEDGVFDADYFAGRMVKLCIIPKEKGCREIIRPVCFPHIEYQSWAGKYPTCKDLINSVLGEN